jgi:hypothetical protein
MELEMRVVDLLTGGGHIELQLARRDESLIDESSLLSGRPEISNFRSVIAGHRIRIQARLNLPSASCIETRPCRRQRRIVLDGQRFHIGQRQRSEAVFANFLERRFFNRRSVLG